MEQHIQIADLLGLIPQLAVSGVTSGCIYAIVAIGFSIIYNSTQVVNFAQGEFVMLGAMVAAVMVAKTSLLIAFPVAVVAGCFAGLLLALLILMPYKRASVITLIIITIGASILMRGLAQLFWGEASRAAAPFTGVMNAGYLEDRVFHIGNVVVQAQQIWVVVITLLLVVGMQMFFRYSLIGKAMRACSISATGARLVGISVRRTVILSFVMAAGLGAVAGVTMSPLFRAGSDMGTSLGLKGFCAAVLGGIGNFGGGVAAGLVLGVVESVGGVLLSSQYKDAIAFFILLAILLIKPQGLLSRKKAGL